MSKAVFYCEFKLKKNADVAEFLAAAKTLNDEYISQQKGYVSWQQLANDDVWVDLLMFETMADVKNFEANSALNPNELAMKFYSYINMMSCKVRYFSIEREY